MDRNTSGGINRPQPRMDPVTLNREWIWRREQNYYWERDHAVTQSVVRSASGAGATS